MPELEVLEAKVPARTPRLEPEAPRSSARPGGGTGSNGPVFSRARDIFAANMSDLLDRAEDPERMIRMIILEMEETLVEIRASAARSIADIKEMQRSLKRLETISGEWTARAELALEKGREDLARAALTERQKADEMAQSLGDEIAQLDGLLKTYEADIAKLQAKLREARGRQNAIAARFEGALSRARANEVLHGSRTRGRAGQVRDPRAPRRLRRRPRRRAGAHAAQGAWKKRSPSFAPPKRSTPSWKH